MTAAERKRVENFPEDKAGSLKHVLFWAYGREVFIRSEKDVNRSHKVGSLLISSDHVDAIVASKRQPHIMVSMGAKSILIVAAGTHASQGFLPGSRLVGAGSITFVVHREELENVKKKFAELKKLGEEIGRTSLAPKNPKPETEADSREMLHAGRGNGDGGRLRQLTCPEEVRLLANLSAKRLMAAFPPGGPASQI